MSEENPASICWEEESAECPKSVTLWRCLSHSVLTLNPFWGSWPYFESQKYDIVAMVCPLWQGNGPFPYRVSSSLLIVDIHKFTVSYICVLVYNVSIFGTAEEWAMMTLHLKWCFTHENIQPKTRPKTCSSGVIKKHVDRWTNALKIRTTT
jgi:hypothetical protein